MAVVTIDDELQARFEAVAAPGETFEAFIVQAVKEALTRRERELAARATAQVLPRTGMPVSTKRLPT